MKLSGIAVAAAALALGATSQAASAGPAGYNWSGAYFGGQAGYGASQIGAGETHMYNDLEGTDEYSGSPLDPFSFNGSGFIGGAEMGYNWQTGPLVVGVVGDISGANIRGTYSDDDAGFSVDSTINWLSTARVNVGASLGRLLVYGTGGIAVGGISNTLTDLYDDGDTVITSHDYETNVGWTIGAGIAAPLGPNWVLKGEYLYVDLGTHDTMFSEPDPGFPLITGSNHTTASIGRLAIDYKF